MSEPIIVAFINTTRENLEVTDIWHFILNSLSQDLTYLEPCPELPEGAVVVTRRHWNKQQVKEALLKHLNEPI